MLLATRTLIASVALIALGGVAVAGCAATSPSAPTERALGGPTVTHSTALPAEASSGVAPDAKEKVSMLPPVIVVPGQSEATARVGDTIVVNADSPTDDVLSTDRPDLLEVTQGSYDGSAWFNPGAVALAEGTTTLTLVHDGHSRSIAITILPAAR